MKRCPTCNRTFEDTQTFCSNDGARLVGDTGSAREPQPTIVAQAPQVPNIPQQPYFNQPASPVQATPQWGQPAGSPPSPAGYGGVSPMKGAPGSNKLVPAAMGGAVSGFLSAIPYVGSCCCIWAVGGGVLSSMMFIKNAPARVEAKEGAIVGAIAGGIAAAIFLVIGLPLSILLDIGTYTGTFGGANLSPTVARAIIWLMGIPMIVVLSAVGGLLGVKLFEKRTA
jgi:hypothetical protein